MLQYNIIVYSEKYAIRYIVNARNKHRNIQCDYIKDFMLGFFFFNSFLTIKPS
jgi:hypothetical protein